MVRFRVENKLVSGVTKHCSLLDLKHVWINILITKIWGIQRIIPTQLFKLHDFLTPQKGPTYFWILSLNELTHLRFTKENSVPSLADIIKTGRPLLNTSIF